MRTDQQVVENHVQYEQRIAYHKSFGYDGEAERAFILQKAMPLDGPVLEVGTGKGYFTVHLARACDTCTSIDIAEDDQRIARMNCAYFGLEKNVDFRVCDAEHLPFEAGVFATVISVNVIHHLVSPYNVADEMIRVLKPRGKIVVSDFTSEGFRLMDSVHASEGHTHTMHGGLCADIRKYLDAKGFIVETYTSAHQQSIVAKRGVQP